MNKKKITFSLIFILIIASALRLVQFDQLPPGLSFDEALNGNQAVDAIRSKNFRIFYPENNGREGLFINIQALFLRAFGWNKTWALRFPSPIFGILTVLGLYFLGKELYCIRKGLFAAFLLATSFWHINLSRLGLRAIMAPLCLVWSIYFILSAIRKYSSQKKMSILYAGIGGIIYGLGFHTYIAYRCTPLLLLLFIPFFQKKEGFWRLTGVFILAALIAILPIAIYFFKNPEDFFGYISRTSITTSKNPILDLMENLGNHIAMLNFNGDVAIIHNVPGRPELFLPVGICFWIGFLIAMYAIWRKICYNKEDRIFFASTILMTWLVLSTLPVIFSERRVPNSLRSILMLPPIMLFASSGGIAIYDKAYKVFEKHRIPKKILRIVLSVFLALLIIEAGRTYFFLWGSNQELQSGFLIKQAELGKKLLDLPRDIPKYIVVEPEKNQYRGIPLAAQPVAFITDTVSPENQKKKNIYYVSDETLIPPDAKIFYIYQRGEEVFYQK